MTDNTQSPGFFSRVWGAFSTTEIPKSEKPLRFGILGAANIAPMALIKPAAGMSDVIVASVAARDPVRAQVFARKHKIGHFHTDYQALIDDPEIDCIYNPLPNGLHYEWTKKALEAGKHVLLEKPCTSNAEQAEELFALAQSKNLKLLEAFHYRHHPSVHRALQMVRDGSIGDVQHVHVNMTFPNVLGVDDIRFQHHLAGGSFMDEGCYVSHIGRLFIGAEPTSVIDAAAKILRPKIDIEMDAFLDCAGKKLEVQTSFNKSYFALKSMLPQLIVKGSEGEMTFSNWIAPSFWHSITVKKNDGTSHTEKAYGQGWTTYRYQLENFVKGVRGQQPDTWISSEDSISNMKMIDSVYEKSGLGKRV